MPENVYHNASSQSTIDTGSNNQYYSTDQETNNQQTGTDPNAESHYDYDAGVCTNDVVSDNGSSTEASFDPSNSSSSEEPEYDYTESDSDSEDEEKNHCDGNDGEDYSDDDSGNDTIDEEDDNKEESTPTQEDDNNDTSDNSEGDFIEKNKDLMQKVCDVLKFIYPDCDITPSEFFTGAQECINKYAGIGSGGQGEGTKETDNSSELVKNLQEYAKKNWIRPVTISDCERKIPTSGGRQFGAKRGNGKRAHSAIDFVVDKVPKEDQIFYAITSGTIIGYSSTYYSGTGAIAVKSDDGSVIRYCEIKAYDKYINYKKEGGKKNVEKGDALGVIIRNNDKEQSRMLHLEIYLGNATGNLTDRNNRDDNKNYPYVEEDPQYIKKTWYMNFERRMDLINPSFVNELDDVNEYFSKQIRRDNPNQ